MRALVALTVGAMIFMTVGCPPSTDLNTTTGDTTGTTGDATGDTTGDTTDSGSSSAMMISGSIAAPLSARKLPNQSTTNEGYKVVVQSAGTMELYTAETDADGNFEVAVPADEAGEVVTMTVVQPDSRVAGQVMFDTTADEGMGAVEIQGDVDVGQVDMPDDPTAAPLMAGDAADLGDSTVAEDVTTRLNENGVPAGVPNIGRGDEAQGTTTDNVRQQFDKDRDGLIDIFDADDDGDGTIDDFDPDATVNPGEADGLTINFFMNLKIGDTQAQTFYDGDTAGIEDILKHNTVITFEVKTNGSETMGITAARIIGPPSPAPSYLPLTEILGPGSGGSALWSDSGYALQPDGDNHFQQFVIPNDFMMPGDTFTVEITFEDGSTKTYERMINYVFRSIPKIVSVGPPGAMTDYTGPSTIMFDGTQDLALEWNPPVDERGELLTGLDYFFEVFYYDADHQQINNIDGAATWASPPAGWDANRTVFEVSGTTLSTPSADGTFTVTLPKEIFVDSVETDSGTVAVSSYKIDIAAQNGGNNSALMLQFEKE